MRRAALAVLLLLSCKPASEQTQSIPDPRLGVVVFETNDRPFSRAPPTSAWVANNQHVLQNRGRLAVAADGTIFVLIGLDAGRPFGTANDVTTSRVLVKKLSPSNGVSDLPSPALGSGGAPKHTAFFMAGDQVNPVIVDAHGAWNPAGRYVAVSTFDGSAWKTVSFLRSDRAPTDVKSTWDPLDDQVKVLRPGVVVVQHGDTLVRHDGAGWVPVTLPAKVKELRLGAADGSRVRAFWLTTDGALETDVLKDDGTWAGAVARLKRGAQPTLAGAWGFAGDVDTFTAHFVASTLVHVARHEEGKLRLATTRPLLPQEQTGGAFLVGTRHPRRTAFVNSSGALTASFAGKEAGPLGAVLAWSGGAPVTCTGDVAVGEGRVIAKDGATCVPRVLQGLDFRLDGELTSLVELFSDEQQDATLRLYVKRIPLPSNVTDVTVEGTATGNFPGDTGMVTPTDQLVVTGRVLVPGATDHSGTTCVLMNKVTSTPVETVQTDTDGTVAFSPVMPGSFEGQCNRPQWFTHSVTWPVGTVGEARLDGVLVQLLPPNDDPWPGVVEYELDGGTLLRRDSSGATVLSRAVASSDDVRVVSGQAAWMESGSLHTTFGATVFPPPHTLASVRGLGSFLVFANGVPDGTTPLDWTLSDGVTAAFPGKAVEVASYGLAGNTCTATLVWQEVAPGDVRVTRGTCTQPVTLVATTQSASAIAPMKPPLSFASNLVFGFTGTAACGVESGFTVACPAQWLEVVSGGVITSGVLSASAVDVRAVTVPGFGSRIVVLEESGTLRASPFGSSVVVDVQSGISLPTSWAPGETPVTAVANSQLLLVRTRDGAVYSSTGAAGSWTKVLDGARTVLEGGYVLLNDGSLSRVLASGMVDALPIQVNENVRVAASGVWSDATEMTCPDGSTCRVLQRMTPDKVITSLAVGRLTPDVVAEPRRFGFPTPRLLKAELAWPTKRVTIPP